MAASQTYDVLFSYARPDAKSVETVAHYLSDLGLKVWFDKWSMIPGAPWQEAVGKAMYSASSVAFFLGPKGVSAPQKEELELLRQRMADQSKRVVSVVLPDGRLEQVASLAARKPDTLLVIDHLGLPQPFAPPAPPEPFADLPKLLGLATYENVTVKITGACTLSHTPFPYDDIWDSLSRIFDEFGFNRCMWGTDWTRAVNLLTYEQGVEAFQVSDRISDSERADLMGRTLQRVYNWSPSAR